MLQHTLTRLFELNDATLIYKDQTLTANELANHSLELIQTLKDMQCSKPIALCLPNSPELLCWQMASFYLGITIIPIIYEHDAKFIEEVLQLTEPCYLLTTLQKQKDLMTIKLPKECKLQVVNNTDQNIRSRKTIKPNANLPPSVVNDNSLAMIIFSSGTTGQAKGIMHTYKSAYGFIEMLFEVLSANDHLKYIVAQPMGHIGGIVTTLLALFKNGTAILLDQFEITQYMQTIEQYRPTHINLHTPLFFNIINYPSIDKSAFSQIITSFAGGDDIPNDLPSQFTAVTGAPMQIGYGMTETGIVIVNKNPYDKYRGSCGRKIASASIELRDEKGQPVLSKEIGEIWIKSPACCQGYWKMPELNQKTIVNGWFRTGDLAYQDQEGYYWYMGRTSQVIHRGKHLVYPKSIEQVLFEYPNIKTAAVISIPDKSEGEVPIAFIELKNKAVDKHIVSAALVKYAKEHLSPWQQPKAVYILDSMPLNLTGKIDRTALDNLYSQNNNSNND